MSLQSNVHVDHREAYHDDDHIAVAQMLQDADWNGIALDELASEFDRNRSEMQHLLNSMNRYASYYKRSDGTYIVTSCPPLQDLPTSELDHVTLTTEAPA